jgi:hypothetical protein
MQQIIPVTISAFECVQKFGQIFLLLISQSSTFLRSIIKYYKIYKKIKKIFKIYKNYKNL